MINTNLTYVYNDGGRAEAGYKGRAGDCVVRALAIAMNLCYKELYQEMQTLCRKEDEGKKFRRQSNARKGINVKAKWFMTWMEERGWKYRSCVKFGKPAEFYLRRGRLPREGVLICKTRRHLVTVKGDELHDTYDSSTLRCDIVYGYWSKDA